MKRFSGIAFLLVGLTHAFISFIVGITTLFTALGASPAHNPTDQVKSAEAFFWLLQTGPALLYHIYGITREKGLLFYCIVWSGLIGVAAGYLYPWYKEERTIQRPKKTPEQSHPAK